MRFSSSATPSVVLVGFVTLITGETRSTVNVIVTGAAAFPARSIASSLSVGRSLAAKSTAEIWTSSNCAWLVLNLAVYCAVAPPSSVAVSVAPAPSSHAAVPVPQATVTLTAKPVLKSELCDARL